MGCLIFRQRRSPLTHSFSGPGSALAPQPSPWAPLEWMLKETTKECQFWKAGAEAPREVAEGPARAWRWITVSEWERAQTAFAAQIWNNFSPRWPTLLPHLPSSHKGKKLQFEWCKCLRAGLVKANPKNTILDSKFGGVRSGIKCRLQHYGRGNQTCYWTSLQLSFICKTEVIVSQLCGDIVRTKWQSKRKEFIIVLGTWKLLLHVGCYF